MTGVLLVDDSATGRLRLRRAIEAALPDPTFHDAATAEEGLAHFLRGGIDIVFLDMLLDPGRSTEHPLEADKALSLMRRILGERPDMPVVLVTALPRQHPDVIRAMSLGAAAYLEKSIDRESVAAALQRLGA